jgi:hypothetical protein
MQSGGLFWLSFFGYPERRRPLRVSPKKSTVWRVERKATVHFAASSLKAVLKL